MKVIHIIIPIILLITSCKSDISNESTKHLSEVLFVADTIKISIPDKVAIEDFGTSWNFHKNMIGFLSPTAVNYLNLNIYDFNRNNWVKVKLNLEGPDQVFSEGSFAFISDSLFYYFPAAKPVVLKINFSGQVLQSHSISTDRSANYYLMNKNPVIGYVNGQIGFDLSEHASLGDPETFYTSRLYGLIDTAKQQDALKIIDYPEEFHGKVWSSNSVGRNSYLLNDTIYFNFVKSKFIYRYDLNGNLIDKKMADIPEIKDAKVRSNSSMTDLINHEMAGYYPKLVYDPWQKVFYRFGVYYASANREISKFSEFAQVAKTRTLAIIVLNKNLDILGVNRFGLAEGVSEKHYFINNQGLYLYSLHRKKEDELAFYLLRFSRGE